MVKYNKRILVFFYVFSAFAAAAAQGRQKTDY